MGARGKGSGPHPAFGHLLPSCRTGEGKIITGVFPSPVAKQWEKVPGGRMRALRLLSPRPRRGSSHLGLRYSLRGAGGFYGVVEEAGDGHGADAAGDRCDGARDFFAGGEI